MYITCARFKTRRINKFKFDDVKAIFSNNDLIFFTETWADDHSDLNVNGLSEVNRVNMVKARTEFKSEVRSHKLNQDRAKNKTTCRCKI